MWAFYFYFLFVMQTKSFKKIPTENPSNMQITNQKDTREETSEVHPLSFYHLTIASSSQGQKKVKSLQKLTVF